MSQMNQSECYFAPVLSTPAGACLTQDNWTELGVKVAVYELSSLLIKPGASYLLTVKDLVTFLGWSQALILDASMLSLDNNGRFMVHSTYDGSRVYLTVKAFWELLIHLKPSIVLLPQDLLHDEGAQQIPTSIMPFFPVNKAQEIPGQLIYGLYGDVSEINALSDIAQQKTIPCYLRDDEGTTDVSECRKKGIRYYASDKPAQDAYEGYVYQSKNTINILDTSLANQFEKLEERCECPTCTESLSWAYLHHLFQSTPLLCQRFLIMHNVYSRL